MNLKEAYSTLGLPEGATKDEAKKAFRKLASTHHPDKGGDAEVFKKINEAYQVVETGKDFGPTNHANQSQQHHGGGYSVDIEDLIRRAGGGNPFNNRNRRQYVVEDLALNVKITFREAVLGCHKVLNYKRKAKCDKCNGNGYCQIDNGCKTCGGSGVITQRRGNMVMQSTCHACQGMQKVESCSTCKEEGFLETNVSVTANIPGGIRDGRNILRLQGIGDYAGSMFGGDQYASVILTVNVETNIVLKIVDNDVVTGCNISLLDAIQGCTRNIETIDGSKEIVIPPLTKHRDEVVLPNLGVSRTGNERVIIDVQYPTHLEPLVEALKKNQEI